MTSNLGVTATIDRGGLGFRPASDKREREQSLRAIQQELEDHFRPEFLNRLDGVVMFDFLDDEALQRIFELELRKVEQRLGSRNIKLEIEPAAAAQLIDSGYSEKTGARGVRHIIEDRIEDQLTELILGGQIRRGDTARIVAEGAGIRIHVEERSREPLSG